MMRAGSKLFLVVLGSVALILGPSVTPAPAAVNNVVWKKILEYPPDPPVAEHVATDRNGNFILGIQSVSSFNIRKFSGGGRKLWFREFKVRNRTTDLTDLAVSNDGSIYTGGTLHLEGGFIAKFGPKGGHHWTRRLTGAGILAVAVGPGGSPYALTASAIKKYDPEGRFVWSRQIPWSPLNVDIGPGGGVYVLAQDWSVSSGSSLVLRKLSPRGGIYWTRQVVTPEDFSGSYRLVVDRLGNPLIVSQYGEFASRPSLMIKYSSRGRRIWTRRWSSNVVQDVTTDRGGNIYLVGKGPDERAVARKYSVSGSVLWTRYFMNGLGRSAATDADGNLFVSASSSGNYTQSYIVKFSR